MLCAVLAFVCASCGIAYYNLRVHGSLYLQSDDGDLYLSIARNLLQNGHFIQTARPIEAFVVPPGLPAMCTLLLFAFGGMSRFIVGAGFADHAISSAGADMLGLLGFQYLVYGAAAALMAVTALRLAENGIGAAQKGLFVWQKGKTAGASVASIPAPVRIPKALPWALAVLMGLAAPGAYLWCSLQIRHPNPGFILTENYVVCLIALILWLAVRGADPRKITITAFILMLFRPACSALFVAALVWMIVKACRGRSSRTSHHKRTYFYDVFVMLAVFAAVLAVNTAINWMETGHAIALEDYGNLDVYLANNEVAGPDWYHSGKVPEFASPRYNEIAASGLSRYEQNELAGQALHEYVTANTGTVLRNAGVRFYRLFFETWGPVWYAFLVCLASQMLLSGLKWPRKVYLGVMAASLSILPAFGLLVARYSAPMLPLLIGVILGTAGWLITAIATRAKSEVVKAEDDASTGSASVTPAENSIAN